MKTLVRLLAKLYPAAWRTKYGAEFDQLLEDSGSRRAWNVLAGALKMQFTFWGYGRFAAAGIVVGIIASTATAFSRHGRSGDLKALLFVECTVGRRAAWDATYFGRATMVSPEVLWPKLSWPKICTPMSAAAPRCKKWLRICASTS